MFAFYPSNNVIDPSYRVKIKYIKIEYKRHY